MKPNQELIGQLRRLAEEGATVRVMLEEIKRHEMPNAKSLEGHSLTFDYYFWKAFLLPLREVRDIEGCQALGGKAFTDDEIDALMLPRIARTRHLWKTTY